MERGRCVRARHRPWHRLTVSFDVFFQGFRAGDPQHGGGERMRRVLDPFVLREEPERSFLLVEYGDGSADVYLDGDGMMVNHITGQKPWELLVEGARAAEWVVMPAGCPTCLTDEAQRIHLPEGLNDDVALVATGGDLLRVIRAC